MAPHITLHDPLMAQETPTHFRYKGPEDFAKAVDTARHYGFHLVEPVEIDDSLDEKAKEHQGKIKREKTGEWYIHLGDKLAELNRYIEDMHGWPQPALICHTRHPRRKVGKVNLTAYGCNKTVAEGLIIAATLAILDELGYENLGVDINCLGNRQAKEAFSERFKNHVKKHLEDMRPTCQTLFKQDPLRLTTCDDDTCTQITRNGPKAVDHLNKEDRCHLKEICEYLEAISAPYRISPALVGSHHHHSHTLFQIKEFDGSRPPHGSPVLARGERHLSVPGKMDYNRSIPTVSASIDIPGGRRESYKTLDREEVECPQVYYLHLGTEAKKHSLPVIEKLRQENITVLQALTRNKLRDQITAAKRLKTPYAVIMGLKEVRENAAIVRDMQTRSQETVSINHLPKYLKKVA